MMFLFNGIRAEVEPVPRKKGWFQLTGNNISRWTVDVEDTFGDLENSGVKVNYDAKILGIHDRDEAIERNDPRFNYENGPTYEGSSFGVYKEAGKLWMLLAVNQAEYAIFRFVLPHEAGGDGEEYDPISQYRKEKKPAKAKPAPKAAAKKVTAKKAAPAKKTKAKAKA